MNGQCVTTLKPTTMNLRVLSCKTGTFPGRLQSGTEPKPGPVSLPCLFVCFFRGKTMVNFCNYTRTHKCNFLKSKITKTRPETHPMSSEVKVCGVGCELSRSHSSVFIWALSNLRVTSSLSWTRRRAQKTNGQGLILEHYISVYFGGTFKKRILILRSEKETRVYCITTTLMWVNDEYFIWRRLYL